MNVAVYRAGALGDVIVTFPVLQSIRRIVPMAHITLIAPPDAGALATMCGWADRLLSSDAQWIARWYGGDADAFRDALGHIDILIVFANDGAPLADTARRAGTPRVVSLAPLPDAGDIHVTDHAVTTIARLFGGDADTRPIVTSNSSVHAAARAVLGSVGVAEEYPYCVVHTGSSSRDRMWPHMDTLLEALAAKYHGVVVANRGPVEVERDTSETEIAKVRYVGPLPATTLAALIENAAFFIGNDTGPTHLAAAVGAKTIGLFGPGSDRAMWAPRGERVTLLDSDGRWPTVGEALAAIDSEGNG